MEIIFFVYFPLVFLVLHLLTTHLLHKLQNLPPTPFLSLPLLGHLYLLKKPLYLSLSRLSDKYGPVVFLRFGSRPVLVVSSPSAAQECFTKNDVVFANRPRLLAGKHLGSNYTNLIFSPYDTHWRNLRHTASVGLLSSHRVQLSSGVRVDLVRSIIKRLSRVNPDHEIELRSTFYEVTFNIMMEMVAGKGDGGRKGDIETVRLARTSTVGDYVPLLRWLGFDRGLQKELMRLQVKRNALMEHLIDGIRSGSDPDYEATNKTLIHVLLSLQTTKPDFYNDQTIKSLLVVLFPAGIDTSVSTMEWAMSHLLNDQEIFRKAKKEIDDLIGDTRLIDESDLSKLPYLTCIINETLRMHHPTPMILPHESSEECTVAGFCIPRGTTLMVNLWAIQNDPKSWVEPRKFMPERFEDLVQGKVKPHFKFMPFGAGRRGCPGENLAMCMVGLTLGSLIQCFDWERISGEMIDMTERCDVILYKTKPLKVKCQQRESIVKLLSQV